MGFKSVRGNRVGVSETLSAWAETFRRGGNVSAGAETCRRVGVSACRRVGVGAWDADAGVGAWGRDLDQAARL